MPAISGASKATVHEDAAPKTLTASGHLFAKDVDTGESHFQAQTLHSAHGDFKIDADGHWTFTADNTQLAIQSLGAHDTL
ncbi:VCBS domain-containing protein, partial [Vibrio breoganii]|uniref:VCBS domain-containing protein n=1 Tax=Vibrio breoganii TaxID=553239 RepID=UPI003BAEC183